MNDESGMMNGKPRDIGERTKAFALRIIRLYVSLPKTTEAQVIGKQVLRSGTSGGAHVREGKRSRSNAELISKIEGGLQELEETVYWLELLTESGILKAERLTELFHESNEIIAILVTSSKTLKNREKKR
jgi:four helix bundle protein